MAVIGVPLAWGNGAHVGGPVLVPGERAVPATRAHLSGRTVAGAAPRPRLSPVITGGPLAGRDAEHIITAPKGGDK